MAGLAQQGALNVSRSQDTGLHYCLSTMLTSFRGVEAVKPTREIKNCGAQSVEGQGAAAGFR